MIPERYTNSFVPTNILLPEEEGEMRRFLTDIFDRISDGVNDREIAQYLEEETVTGQKWLGSINIEAPRSSLRKVIDFGPLPNSTTKSVAHGITTNANTVFTKIYACATDPGVSTITRSIPIPYVDPNTPGNGIELYIDATNVNITTTIAYNNYSQCYVVLEYLQY